MSRRQIKRMVQGHPAVDGAGVHLVRVLGIKTVEDYDPFLMLDSFDSLNPDDYTAGFPFHPHRGIETITYLVEGDIEHQDSLGNKGSIKSGQSQWMTAGSGIIHQELPKPSPRMLGLQIWLNLPKQHKLTKPHYFDITHDMIKPVRDGATTVRIISGEFNGVKGVQPPYVQASLFDVSLPRGEELVIATKPDENVFIFLIENDAIVEGERVQVKTAVLFGPGDEFAVTAPTDLEAGADLRFMFFSGKPLREPVAWGGPIVMNTEEELDQAFTDLESGNFIQHEVRI